MSVVDFKVEITSNGQRVKAVQRIANFNYEDEDPKKVEAVAKDNIEKIMRRADPNFEIHSIELIGEPALKAADNVELHPEKVEHRKTIGGEGPLQIETPKDAPPPQQQ